MSRRLVLVCLVSVLLVRHPGDGAAAAPSASAPDLRALAGQFEQHWLNEILPCWFPRCVDRAAGGFFCDFQEDWSPSGPNDKTVVFQSRMTWVAAEVARRYPSLREEYLGYMRHGVEGLRRHLWDRQHGGFFWAVRREGGPTSAAGTEKHVYGIAFALYAVSNAYRAQADPATLQLARETFAWLEKYAHDEQHQGYHEAITAAGVPILGASASSSARRGRDLIGTPYGFRSMNSHIHLLEAVTAFCQAAPDPLARRRLEELFLLVRDRIAVEPGCLNLYFTRDWRPVPDHDSFGHDIETAYLLLEAAEVLGRHEPRTEEVARSLVDHALQWGWDEAHGGFYDKGAAFAPAWGTEKIWWPQAEGLNALALMYVRHGRTTPRYAEALRAQWEFIRKHQVDARHGGWYNSVSADGRPHPGQAKASPWKAAYHNGRALMNAAELLRGGAGGPGGTP